MPEVSLYNEQYIHLVYADYEYKDERRSYVTADKDEVWAAFSDKTNAAAFAAELFERKRSEYHRRESDSAKRGYRNYRGAITVYVSAPIPTSQIETFDFDCELTVDDHKCVWISSDTKYDYIYSPDSEFWEYDSDENEE